MKQKAQVFQLLLLTILFTPLTHFTMAQKSAADMVKSAKQEIENLTPQQANAEIKKGDVTVIDIREPDELLKNGKIAGATNAPRGMLEFYADPTLPYHKPEFDKEKRIILYCASSGRSALAVKTLKEMGYKNVAHIDGGLKAWTDAGLPIDSSQ
ncbi:MAG: rhodanese-like domain-containing protein [Chitinophagaceae bacterium]|nr:rhodanese-like domain-containing protein [Chitinophagaceae bacterium]